MSVLLGIDTGGTYTDAVLLDEARNSGEQVIASAKALTTRHDLAVGIGEAIDAVLSDSQVTAANVSLVSLSTTLATNALVEGQGESVCLVFIGFAPGDLDRAGLRDALKDDPVIMAPGGHTPAGDPQAAIDLAAIAAEIDALKAPVAGYAVASHFAVRNPEHESAVRDLIRERTGLPVTCSHELSAKLGGPKRALTSVLHGGWVSYANAAKSDWLGVAPGLIEVHGAVSAEVAAAMVRGALDRSGTDWAVAVTGIAGPDGGTDDKPVGTVDIGVGRTDGAVRVRRFRFSGGRTVVRRRSVSAALQFLRMAVLDVPEDVAMLWAVPAERESSA